MAPAWRCLISGSAGGSIMKSLMIAGLLFASALSGANAAQRIVLPQDVVPDHYDIAVTTDAPHLTFTGSVKIGLKVARPTRTIKLNAADLAFNRVSLSGAAAAPKVIYDAKEETATLTFPVEIAAGQHVLSIDYRGKINQQAAGLFALDYD